MAMNPRPDSKAKPGPRNRGVSREEPAKPPRSVTVLGCTGSVGTQTIDLLLGATPGRFQVRALVAGRNASLLAEQAIALRPNAPSSPIPPLCRRCVTPWPAPGSLPPPGTRRWSRRPNCEADWTMAAITGAAGLASTLAAIRRGKAVGLANKEALVCAGEVMLRAVAEAGATLLPVDSEHNAIFQSMADGNHGAIETHHPDRVGRPVPYRDQGGNGARHGGNRAAASGLVDGRQDQHRLGHDDEQRAGTDRGRAPVQFAWRPRSMSWSIRNPSSTGWSATTTARSWRSSVRRTCASRSLIRWPGRTDGDAVAAAGSGARSASLEFEEPDPIRFPALRLARDALRAGGGTPAILNAANEVAVEAFLQRQIGFLDIVETVGRVLRRDGHSGRGDVGRRSLRSTRKPAVPPAHSPPRRPRDGR